jgi:hypothetical protein
LTLPWPQVVGQAVEVEQTAKEEWVSLPILQHQPHQARWEKTVHLTTVTAEEEVLVAVVLMVELAETAMTMTLEAPVDIQVLLWWSQEEQPQWQADKRQQVRQVAQEWVEIKVLLVQMAKR